MWKGSVGDCLYHLCGKHGGSQFLALKSPPPAPPPPPPPLTVPRDFWHAALQPGVSGIAVDVKLFQESGCRLVHKYRIYHDPLPYPALRDRVVKKSLRYVN